MMRRIIPGLVLLCGCAALADDAAAQQGRNASGALAEPPPRLAAPGASSQHGLPAKPAAGAAGNLSPCPEYGAGFVRQPGSSTCFRLGAGITVEQQWRDRRSQLADPALTQATARIGLDARTQTQYGPLRTVIGVSGALPR